MRGKVKIGIILGCVATLLCSCLGDSIVDQNRYLYYIANDHSTPVTLQNDYQSYTIQPGERQLVVNYAALTNKLIGSIFREMFHITESTFKLIVDETEYTIQEDQDGSPMDPDNYSPEDEYIDSVIQSYMSIYKAVFVYTFHITDDYIRSLS